MWFIQAITIDGTKAEAVFYTEHDAQECVNCLKALGCLAVMAYQKA